MYGQTTRSLSYGLGLQATLRFCRDDRNHERYTSNMTERIRPTKKQQELLRFIDGFIAEHGYSPSYREIMSGCGYKSVATVALHVDNLIKRGHLRKRDHSARSLEVVDGKAEAKVGSNKVSESEEKWLVEKVDHFFKQVEQSSQPEKSRIDELYVLVGALKVLGLDGAANAFIARLTTLKSK